MNGVSKSNTRAESGTQKPGTVSTELPRVLSAPDQVAVSQKLASLEVRPDNQRRGRVRRAEIEVAAMFGASLVSLLYVRIPQSTVEHCRGGDTLLDIDSSHNKQPGSRDQ
jgi:hypothetical protein